jgi:flagellar export protein FliJ
MAFHFALAALLRLRQSVERQRTLQMQEANLQVARANAKLAEVDQSLKDSSETGETALHAGRTGAEIQFSLLVRENLQRLRLEFLSEISKLEVVRQKALVEYQKAYRDREVLETLRRRQRQVYQQEELRRQQQELDAAYLLQRWHRRD